MKQAPTVIITAHANADFDALGSMVAAAKLYPGAALILPSSQEEALRNFYVQSVSYMFNFTQLRDIDLHSVHTLVLVDVRQRSRLEHVAEVLALRDLEVHIYDHHPPSPESGDDIAGTLTQCRSVGATVTILSRILMEKGIALHSEEATLLALGLYEDTGNFTFNSVTPEDFQAAAWLCTQGMDTSTISHLLKQDMNAEQVAVLNTLLQSAVRLDIKGVPVVLTEIQLDHYMADISVLVQKMADMENIEVLFALCFMHDRIYLVARSRNPDVDAARICKAFDGGGHASAAAATVKDKTLHQLKDELRALLFSSVRGQKSVRDVMTSPVFSVREATDIKEAADLMERFGLKAAPVLNEAGECTGFLVQQIAARAKTYGLGHQPVSAYMQRNPGTVTPEDGLAAVTEIIVGQQQRLVPVLENDALVGVVTRTDLIKLLIDAPDRVVETLRPNTIKAERMITPLMKKTLPAPVFDRLAQIGRIGDELGESVYCVGGFVRDILLQRPNLDMDIVVEGDAILFARALAKELGGRVREHQKFRTAMVIYEPHRGAVPPAAPQACGEQKLARVLPDHNTEEAHIDVATARLEYYAQPGALPTIERSSLKMDLYRRDFTINALAVQLNERAFGQLEDFFGAQHDIKEKSIRVLHSLSFVDDPTRILRAIRFEQRYGFTISQQSQRLIKNAVQLKLVEKLGSSRLMHEFSAMCGEQNFLASFLRMQEFKVLHAIDPILTLTPKKSATLARLEAHMRWYGLLHQNALTPWLAVLICLCGNAKYEEAQKLADRFGLSERQRRDFLDQREQVRHRVRQFSSKNAPVLQASELRHTLSPLCTEAIVSLMAALASEDAQRDIANYLLKTRDETPDITGADLKEIGIPPGPIYTRILNAALDAKLDGHAQSRDEQIHLAVSMWVREKETPPPGKEPAPTFVLGAPALTRVPRSE